MSTFDKDTAARVACEHMLFTAAHSRMIVDSLHYIVFISPQALYAHWNKCPNQVVISPSDLNREQVEEHALFPSVGLAMEIPYVNAGRREDNHEAFLDFNNGRHRAAFLTGIGMKEIPIEVDRHSADEILTWKGVRAATAKEVSDMTAAPPRPTVYPITEMPRIFDPKKIAFPVLSSTVTLASTAEAKVKTGASRQTL